MGAGNGERGLTQIKYHDWVTDADTRLSYYNPKYPWIEAVHKFKQVHKFSRFSSHGLVSSIPIISTNFPDHTSRKWRNRRS